MKKTKSLVDYFREELENPGRPQSGEIATRDLATFYSVMGALPNPDPVLKKAGKDITTYEKLVYDDQVGMCIEALELSIQSMPWEIEGNGADERWVEELTEMMKCWDNDRIISESVNARLYGYQPFEVLWRLQENTWEVKDIVGKPPEWFRFDNENRLLLRTAESGFKGVPVDHASEPYKFITARNKPSFKNPYGVAALSRVFWPVAFKKGGLKFWLKFIEKYGIPFLIGKQPRGSSEDATEKLLDNLENMVQDAVAVIPDDSSVDVLEAAGKGASGDLFEKHVKYHDAAIAKAIIGQTLTSSSGQDGSGSYALGNVHMQVFDNVREGTAKNAKKIYDRVFAWLTEINRGPDAPAPTFNWVAEEDVQKERAERDEILNRTGVTFSKKYFAKRYNLEEEDFEAGPGQNAEVPAEALEQGCSCGCGGNPFTHFENTVVAEDFPDQHAVDTATDDTKGRTQELQRQGETLLAPVIEALNQAESYEEAFVLLAGQFPELDAKRLEERLAKAIFVTEVYGRVQAGEEAGDDT